MKSKDLLMLELKMLLEIVREGKAIENSCETQDKGDKNNGNN